MTRRSVKRMPKVPEPRFNGASPAGDHDGRVYEMGRTPWDDLAREHEARRVAERADHAPITND